jgi:hypothetical protein
VGEVEAAAGEVEAAAAQHTGGVIPATFIDIFCWCSTILS